MKKTDVPDKPVRNDVITLTEYRPDVPDKPVRIDVIT